MRCSLPARRMPKGAPIIGCSGRSECAARIAARRSKRSRRQRRRALRAHVDMRQHLLGDRDLRPAGASVMRWKICRRLASRSTSCSVRRQRIAQRDFGEIADAGVDRIEREAARAIGLVDADETEERVGGVAEDEEIDTLAHVAVIVGPFRLDRCRRAAPAAPGSASSRPSRRKATPSSGETTRRGALASLISVS